MVRHLHITKLDQVQASSDVWAGSVITSNAIFFDDICLRDHGDLKAYKLRADHVPTFLEGKVDVLPSAGCKDYLQLAQSQDLAWTIHELFPEHYWDEDFEEVPLASGTWQPKIDALQAQIDDLDSTYARDAEVVAAFATQIAAAGDIFNLVATKVEEEKTRAVAAEQTLTNDLAAEASTARVNEQAIETFFLGTNSTMDADRAQIKVDFAAGDQTNANAISAEASAARTAEGVNQAAISGEVTRAQAAEQTLTNDLAAEASAARTAEGVNQAAISGEITRAQAAEQTLTNDLAAEASTARTAEGANQSAIAVERTRIDAILDLSDDALNTFKEIEDAYKLADSSVETTVTNLVNARVTISTYNTEQAAQDLLISANTAKVTYDAQSAVAANTAKRTYPQSEEDKVTANTAKVTYDAQSAVAANTAKRSYPQSEEDKVTANTLKISYSASASSAVAANTAKRSYPQSEEDKVAANHLKVSYTDASTVSGHTADIAANASAIAGKQSALSSASGLNLNGDNAAIGIAAPGGGTKFTVKGHVQFIKSNSTQVLKIHSGNTIEASSAVHDAIDLRVHGTGGVRMSQYSGGVNEFASFKHAGSTIASNLTLSASEINFTNLPTSDPGVAGRLWRDGTAVKVSV